MYTSGEKWWEKNLNMGFNIETAAYKKSRIINICIQDIGSSLAALHATEVCIILFKRPSQALSQCEPVVEPVVEPACLPVSAHPLARSLRLPLSARTRTRTHTVWNRQPHFSGCKPK